MFGWGLRPFYSRKNFPVPVGQGDGSGVHKCQTTEFLYGSVCLWVCRMELASGHPSGAGILWKSVDPSWVGRDVGVDAVERREQALVLLGIKHISVHPAGESLHWLGYRHFYILENERDDLSLFGRWAGYAAGSGDRILARRSGRTLLRRILKKSAGKAWPGLIGSGCAQTTGSCKAVMNPAAKDDWSLLCVCLSARNNSALTGRISLKIRIRNR